MPEAQTEHLRLIHTYTHIATLCPLPNTHIYAESICRVFKYSRGKHVLVVLNIHVTADCETGDYFHWLLSPFINKAVASKKWEAAKCQSQQLTNTGKTCDIYLMLGQFEKACSILKVKWASYLKDNHFSLLHKKTRYQPSEPPFITHEWTDTCSVQLTPL